MVAVTASPLLGGLLGALLSLGLVVIVAAWTGQLGRSATRTRRPLRVDHFTLRVASLQQESVWRIGGPDGSP